METGEKQGEGRHGQWCHCGKLARMLTSWTSSNPGRRFLVCPKSKGGEGKCKDSSKVKNIVGCYVAFLVGGVCHEDELGTLAVVQWAL
ncbi:unnamed protein product [Prunus armeniaca]